jgi:hypothetical protein
VWGAYNSWVLPLENKYPSLSVEYTSVQDFKGAFVQSEEGNNPPRIIKYKGYNGSIWSQSFQMSDDGNDPTGLQKPEVGSLSGSTTIIAYAGSNYSDVYFDNESWTTGGSITVTAPNGGETWGVGTMQNITWTSSGVTNARIELSINNGSTWTDITASTPSTGSFSWTVSNTPSNQCIVRISDVSDPSTSDVSDAVFTIEVVPGVENDLSGIPDSYQLLQNFPNPFNPSTTIYYGLPEESSVVLRIYDILGNEVFRHEEEQKPAGYHKSDFDASQLNSGVYFYRIEAGDFVKTMKMLLLK